MKGDADHLLRTAMKALLAYAPARDASVPCPDCRAVVMNGQHKPDCKWMRARSVIGAIRSYQRGNR